MQFSNTKEDGLESIIVNWLVNQNDYEQGTNIDYNRDYAIDETRLFRFLQDTQPDALEKLGVFKTDIKKKQFLNRLQGEIAKRGVIDVLRNGVKVYPANLIMFYLTPTENNAKAKEMYEKNIFSVTRQLISGKPIYRYHDTKFSLSKKQIIDLLMGTKLYGKPGVALRELLQNSIDACLLRQKLSELWGIEYTPKVKVSLYTKNNVDYLRVSDNGVGMNQHIIDNYYTNVGCSYYSSREFSELMVSFKLNILVR